MKNQIIALLLLLVSTATFAQHDHHANASATASTESPTFIDKALGSAYNNYLSLKNALVASNADDAKKFAAELSKSLSSMKTGKKVAEEASKISSSSELKEQRKVFSALSNEMTTLVKASKLSAGSLYVEYCPMANSNEGAFWLSNEKEIKNPYFGDMMLKCGSVKETIQ